MKLLAIGRPRPGVDVQSAIARHVNAELQRLWKMYVDGFVREMYSPGGPGIVLVLEAGDAGQARASLAKLPLVTHDIIEFELIELHPFAALQMLFDEETGTASET